jgi:hypothetical protein
VTTRIFVDDSNLPRKVVIDGVEVPAVLSAIVAFAPLQPMRIELTYTDPDTRVVRPGDPEAITDLEQSGPMTLGQD